MKAEGRSIGELLKPRREKAVPAEHSDLPYVGLEHVEAHTTKLLGSVPATQMKSTANRFRTGDVLYSRLRPYLNKVWRADRDGLCSSEFIVLPGNDSVDANFLRYRLNAHDFVSFANSLNAGDRPRVDFAQISSFCLPPFSLAAQRRIVAEIEKQFTRLEAGVAALRRVQANLKRYRAAVLKAACEGRLVPTEAELTAKNAKSAKNKSQSVSAISAVKIPGYENGAQLLARILAERRQNWQGRGKYKEPTAPDTAKLPEIPDGWTWATVEQLTSLVTSGSRGWGDYYSDSGPLFIRAQDIKTDSLTLEGVARVALPEKAEGTRSSVENSDLLVTITGANVTKSAIVRGLSETAFVSQHVALLKPVCREAAAFHFLWIVSPAHGRKFLEKWAYGAGKPGLSLEQVRTLPVALPSLAEQTRIVAEVERRLSVVEELESVVSANLQRATLLRQSILQKAFAGELVATVPAIQISDIIPPLKPEHVHPPNSHFARALLSAEIVHRLHIEPTFGRIKHQKIFHLCEHIAQIEEIHGQYHREAAGPLDNKLIYANEAELKKQKWYQEVRRESYGHAYKALAKAGGHRKYVERYWADKLPTIEKLIELMRKWDTERCEIFCTAYAAWNDLILWGKQATEDNILHEILERWHDSKRRFPEDRWRKAIGWMKEKGFVPTGFGKPTSKPA